MSSSTAVPPPQPGPPTPTTTITVGLCASAKKHQQSFDALREAGALHDQRVFHEFGRHSGRINSNACQEQETSCSSSSRPKGRNAGRLTQEEHSRSATPLSSPRPPPWHPVNNCVFRFVNLNYDEQHHCIVACADAEIKGLQPPKHHNPSQQPHGAGNAREEGTEGTEGTEVTDTATTTSESGAAAAEAARVAEKVDVVLHKVATFGTPSAIRALERWCKTVQKQRSAHRRPPLVVVDPLKKVQLLMTRSMLYKLLDNPGTDGRSVALIPRTFMWDRPGNAGGAAQDTVATPLGIHSFTNMEEENKKDARANGTSIGRWWIAKPDEGTGPAYTHFLVMWRTRDPDVRVPAEVQTALPKEADRFILQELYVYALPMVIKVYCIGPHIYIKVNPTVNLLSHLWESTRGSTVVDVPVNMDSQDKAFFSAVASLSGTTSRPNLSQVTSGADYGAQPTVGESPPSIGVGRAHTITTPTTTTNAPLTEQPGVPAELSREALQNAAATAADPAEVNWEAMIAPGAMWDAFLAPGTPAYVAISKMAQDMSGYGGIGLSMYGFDIVLVPQHLAHAYQRKASRGIGHTEGGTVRYESATGTAAGASAAPSSAVPQPFKANDMFDLATGAPTPLLLDSIPVVIDVNYFPGYKGVAEAGQHMLELMAVKHIQAKNGAKDEMPRSRDKKHHCDAF